MTTWGDEDLPADGRQLASLDEFVCDVLAPLYRRSLDGGARVWCPQWRVHGEAVSRLTGLWLAWEKLSTDEGTGLSTWWLSHCDPCMAVLLDRDSGPFAACGRGHSDRLEPLPCS